jgi:fructose/tagatose bisphosphate aldolase
MSAIIFKNINQLRLELKDIISFHDPLLTLHKPELIHKEVIDHLVYTLVFTHDDTLKAKTNRIIRQLAAQSGIHFSSIHPFYQAYTKGAIGGFTAPAINIRMLTYDIARTIFRIAKRKKAAAFIIEIAHSESEYTNQTPDEFTAVILAAAIKERYQCPIFLQGDHCQFNAGKYHADPSSEMARMKNWVTLLIDAGFYNIDIDGSTLVDLSKPSVHAQQKENTKATAEITRFIREKEQGLKSWKVGKLESKKAGISSPALLLSNSSTPICIGGEIGHIGDKNSTVEEFETFMTQYINQINRGSGISKISVQTGTNHGGIVNPDGTIQKMPVDFAVLTNIGKIARTKYGLAGAVQHGASTLPVNYFHKFVDSGTVEIHLSTGFQNIVFDTMPKELRENMYKWVKKEKKAEWKKEWSDEQFIYKTRKKSLGPFKKQLWNLSNKEKEPIIKAIEEYVNMLFTKLNINETKKMVEKYVI